MKRSSKKSISSIGSNNLQQVKQNPYLMKNQLVSLKRKKYELNEIKQLKATVEKQLKIMLKKDQAALKIYLKKKMELQSTKQRHQTYIKNIQYKQHYKQAKQQQQQKIKAAALDFKKSNQKGLSQSKFKCYLSKKRNAQKLKDQLNQLRNSRLSNKSRTLELNQSRYQKIYNHKQKVRIQNQKFIQSRHDKIVQTKRQQIARSQSLSLIDKNQIEQMEKDLLNVIQRTAKKNLLIKKMDQNISIKMQQAFNFSKSRISINSSRISKRSNKQQQRTSDEQQNKNKNKSFKNRLKTKSQLMPNIYRKLYHNQV